MNSFTNFRMELRPRSELTTGLVLYGETEPTEMQIENLWKIVDRRTGAELIEPRPNLSEFSKGDIMYPSMRKPEVRVRWDQRQCEYESAKEQYSRIKRQCHARFIRENRSLPLAQDLAKTEYGRDVLAELGDNPEQRSGNKFYSASNRLAQKRYKSERGKSSKVVLLNSEDELDNLEEAEYYWTMHPKSGACQQCQNMAGVVFRAEPGPVHPNCKCEIKRHAVLPKDEKPEQKPKDKEGYPYTDKADQIKKALRPGLENWARVHNTWPGIDTAIQEGAKQLDNYLKRKK